MKLEHNSGPCHGAAVLRRRMPACGGIATSADRPKLPILPSCCVDTLETTSKIYIETNSSQSLGLVEAYELGAWCPLLQVAAVQLPRLALGPQLLPAVACGAGPLGRSRPSQSSGMHASAAEGVIPSRGP